MKWKWGARAEQPDSSKKVAFVPPPEQPERSNDSHRPPPSQHGPQRTTSPLSLTPSTFSGTPWARSLGPMSSLSNLTERDPSMIYASTTWTEIASPDLVMNLGTRERTRQEALWEIVSSSERYVGDLHSLLLNYVQPLLHPMISQSPSSPAQSPSSPPPPEPPRSPSPARPELPIAARFLRSVGALEDSSAKHLNSSSEDSDKEKEKPGTHGTSAGGYHGLGFIDMGFSTRSLPQGGGEGNMSDDPSSTRSPHGRTGRLSSLPFRHRHPLRPAPSATKLRKSSRLAPSEALLPPPLPDDLRIVLEVIPDLVKGEEELSNKLKDKWVRDFPLVRGLAGIWSEQDWFLPSYSTYVTHLEGALEAIDTLLPSTHSPHAGGANGADKTSKRLARTLMGLEEKAGDAGECGLAICLSKPLMRLGKLPLLMNQLLYHTDATTIEYERTRAMAFEIEGLVRTLESDKVEEDMRVRVRDVMARIDGIKEKALMVPRSQRILLEETQVWSPSPSSPPQADPRRALSASSNSEKPVLWRLNGASKEPGSSSSRTVKRLSDLVGRSNDKEPALGSKKDLWLVAFSDVVIRCRRVGLTDMPMGSVSSNAAKGQKVHRTAKKRNLYQFLRVERWEMRDLSGSADADGGVRRRAGIIRMEDVAKASAGGEHWRGVTEEEVLGDSDGETVDGFGSRGFDTESRMSFMYFNDDPKPLPAGGESVRDFSSVLNAPSPEKKGRSSIDYQDVLAKQTPAKNKYGNRLRPSSDSSASPTPSPLPQNDHLAPGLGRNKFGGSTTASRARAALNNQRAASAAATLPPVTASLNRDVRPGSKAGVRRPSATATAAQQATLPPRSASAAGGAVAGPPHRSASAAAAAPPAARTPAKDAAAASAKSSPASPPLDTPPMGRPLGKGLTTTSAGHGNLPPGAAAAGTTGRKTSAATLGHHHGLELGRLPPGAMGGKKSSSLPFPPTTRV